MSNFSIESILGLNQQEDEASSSRSPETEQRDIENSVNPTGETRSDDSDHQPSTKRRRTSFSANQISTLESCFTAVPYPDAYVRSVIASHVGISTSKVQVWFQNRRARYRKRDRPNQPLQRTLFAPSHFYLPPAIMSSLATAQPNLFYTQPITGAESSSTSNPTLSESSNDNPISDSVSFTSTCSSTVSANEQSSDHELSSNEVSRPSDATSTELVVKHNK